MATINHTSDVNLASGYVKVEWAGIGPGDEAQAFECNGLKLTSIQYSGDFGNPAGTVRINGSNELSPANFGEFAASGTPKLDVLPDGPYVMGAVRPVVDTNIVSIGVAMIFTK